MTVLVVRPDDNFSQRLRDAGVEVINLDLLDTEVLEDLSEFEDLISRIDEYDGVFFTSPAAAKVFADRVRPTVKLGLYALGERAAAVLEGAGFKVRRVPHANTAEEMLAGFGSDEFSGKKLLFVSGERSMRTIPETLGAIANVDEVAVYRTIEVEPADDVTGEIRGKLATGEIEWVCFFSPSAVHAFEKRFGSGRKVAAIGETTAARAREMGFDIGLTASRAASDVFAKELIARLAH